MKKSLVNISIGASLLAFSLAAHAQAWPEKPITWIVGYPPGGGSDAIVRVLAERMSSTLGQSVIVDNRPGANTIISAQAIVRAAPDGYTMLLADNGTLINNAALYKNLSYDPIKDLDPVSLVGGFELALVVNPKTGIKDFADLKAQATAEPTRLNYSSIGIGSPFHIGMEVIEQEAGIQLTHVPYKGTGPAVQALLGGEVQVAVAPLGAVIQHIKAGTLTAIANAGVTRSTHLPDTPSLDELGISAVPAWQALVVPANTPEAIKVKLGEALEAALAEPQAVRLMHEMGYKPQTSLPGETKAFQMDEFNRWHKFITDRGITLE